jgi:hypothetical protein
MLLIRAIATALGLFGAVAASQLPEFVQQYRQRLGGAIDELSRVVARFDTDALANRLTREGALDKLAQSPDDLVRRRARDAEANIQRLAKLEDQRRAMREAGPFTRVLRFFLAGDDELISATLKDFEPAVPTTGEGLVAAALGFVAGWGLTRLFGWPVRRWRERRRLSRMMPHVTRLR